MSVTVQVTVVLPTGNELGASLLTFCTAQLSAVVGVPRVMFASARLQAPASLLRRSGAVAVMVQVSVVLPTGNELGASLLTFCTAQLSAVVGVPSVMFAKARLQAPASL